jgi:hypothetical protein
MIAGRRVGSVRACPDDDDLLWTVRRRDVAGMQCILFECGQGLFGRTDGSRSGLDGVGRYVHSQLQRAGRVSTQGGHPASP